MYEIFKTIEDHFNFNLNPASLLLKHLKIRNVKY